MGNTSPTATSLSCQGAFNCHERTILSLVAEDLTDQQIGEQLGLSARTVSNRLSLVYVKLGVRGRAGAVVMALAKGIIALPKVA